LAAHQARKLIRGAPRYRFSVTGEKVSMRFTNSKNKNIHSTQILDISESGIAFSAHSRQVPSVGDLIKMDFHLFATVQMAVFGRVVRIEAPQENSSWASFPNSVKIGVTFHQLPSAYQKALTQSLKSAFRKAGLHYESTLPVETKPKSTPINFKNLWIIQNFWSVSFTIAAILALIFLGRYLVDHQAESEQKSGCAGSFFEKMKQ
jgi:hypothetical protein